MIEATIVADSSPLISLALIQQLDILPCLYRSVCVPPAVWEEVTLQGAGLPGADEVKCLEWLQVKTPDSAWIQPLSILVDKGEAEVIALAQTFPAHIVLIDDARARRVAERFNLKCIGTVGLLRRAKKAGLIVAIKPYLFSLQEKGIYIRQALIDAVLKDMGE